MPTYKRVADLQEHLGYWLRIVSNAVSQSFARKLEAEGTTVAEWAFLRVLYDAEPIAPSLLADRMAMTKGAISKLAYRLVGKDLVNRAVHAEGQRGQALSLTRTGRALVPRLAKLADQNDASFFDVLTASERGVLENLLRKVVSERRLTNVPIE